MELLNVETAWVAGANRRKRPTKRGRRASGTVETPGGPVRRTDLYTMSKILKAFLTVRPCGGHLPPSLYEKIGGSTPPKQKSR